MEKTINPTKLSSEDAHLLRALLDQAPMRTAIYKKDKTYPVTPPAHKHMSSSLVDLKLTHTIIKRKREKHIDAYRFDVVDHDNLIDTGGFSHVFPIAGTFNLDEPELHLHTNKKTRGESDLPSDTPHRQ